MSSRFRLLLTVLVVGGAVLTMHVETSINRPDGHHAAAHDSHEDCEGDRCSGQPSHLIAMCSVILIAVGGALIARRFGPAIRGAIDVTLSTKSGGTSISPPNRPPDRAALSVMRC